MEREMLLWFIVIIIAFGSTLHLLLSSFRFSREIEIHNVTPRSEVGQLPANDGENNDSGLLFIHVPKSGGTSFTSLLRKIQCTRNQTKYSDCCRNPGSCFIKGFRRCISIIGCVSHHPRSSLISSMKYSIVLLREPRSRIVSGWFYPGHNPNNDAFNVRSEFVNIRKKQTQRITFEQYLQMSEYRDVQTRMLGADSFPYRNISVDDKVLQLAKDYLNKIFFVGLQEEMVVSGLLLLRKMDLAFGGTGDIDSEEMRTAVLSLPRERSTSSHAFSNSLAQSGVSFGGGLKIEDKVLVNNYSVEAHTYLMHDEAIGEQILRLNRFDSLLYSYAQARFCNDLKTYPDLHILLSSHSCISS